MPNQEPITVVMVNKQITFEEKKIVCVLTHVHMCVLTESSLLVLLP